MNKKSCADAHGIDRKLNLFRISAGREMIVWSRFIAFVNRALTLDSGPHHAVTLLYHDLTANFLTVLSPLQDHPLGIASHHTFAPNPHTLFS